MNIDEIATSWRCDVISTPVHVAEQWKRLAEYGEVVLTGMLQNVRTNPENERPYISSMAEFASSFSGAPLQKGYSLYDLVGYLLYDLAPHPDDVQEYEQDHLSLRCWHDTLEYGTMRNHPGLSTMSLTEAVRNAAKERSRVFVGGRYHPEFNGFEVYYVRTQNSVFVTKIDSR